MQMKEFLQEGWHPPETDGVRDWAWSYKEATLSFPPQHQGFSLELSGCPSRKTPLLIMYRNRPVKSYTLTNAITTVNIPPGVNSCRINMPHTWSPMKILSSLDQRQLGICLHGIPAPKVYSQACSWAPQIIEMNLVGICNITPPCVMCVTRNSQCSSTIPYQDKSVIAEMMPYFNQAKIVSLHGIEGEPLLSPQLFDIISAIGTRKTYVMFATNGLLLTEEASNKFIALGLQEINFSVDAATPSTYRKIRNNDGFSTLINNIIRLVTLKKELGSTSPRVVINMALMKANMAELPAFVELAHKIGADIVLVRFLVPLFENYEVTTENFRFNYFEQRIDPESNEFKKIITVVKKKALQCRISIQSDNPEIMALLNSDILQSKVEDTIEQVYLNLYGEIAEKDRSMFQPELFCQRPWQSVLIGLDGSVRFCCHSGAVLGNLHATTFAEIWNGEMAQSIRGDFLKGGFPRVCTRCPLCFRQQEIWEKNNTHVC